MEAGLVRHHPRSVERQAFNDQQQRHQPPQHLEERLRPCVGAEPTQREDAKQHGDNQNLSKQEHGSRKGCGCDDLVNECCESCAGDFRSLPTRS